MISIAVSIVMDHSVRVADVLADDCFVQRRPQKAIISRFDSPETELGSPAVSFEEGLARAEGFVTIRIDHVEIARHRLIP